MNLKLDDSNYNSIINILKKLEMRISRIEEHLNREPIDEIYLSNSEPEMTPIIKETTDQLENRIGQYWFAKIGIVVLAIGIVFLLTFPYQNLQAIIPCLFGYLLVMVIIALSYYLRKSFSYISGYLLGGSLLLLFFTTMRLHFFSLDPVITSKPFILFLLLIVVFINLVVSVYRKSVYMAALNLTTGYIAAIVGSVYPYFLFIFILFLSSLSVYFKLKYNWRGLVIYGTILTYFTHFIWFINNPFLGNEPKLLESPSFNIGFILMYILIFAFASFAKKEKTPDNNYTFMCAFLNCFGSYILFLTLTFTKFQNNFNISHISISILFLIISIAFWIRKESKYSTFLYSIFGYIAMSVAIIAGFEKPDFFIWLCWQSLLVIITAIWFRSKIIIVTNFLIFLFVFLTYIIIAEKLNGISISFGIVALLSARIMNWKKHRLQLKTELMRNSYLAMAFFIFPYALYHAVPNSYVSLSWIMVTLFYYLLSVVLHNKKYRWMALLTLLMTVGYVLIVGIIKLEPVYRIISFLVLGVVMMIVSLIYARMKSKIAPAEKNKIKDEELNKESL